MCWCDIGAAEQSNTKPFICAGEVCQSERQTAGSRGPRAVLWAPLPPSLHPFTLSFSPLLSHHSFPHSLTLLYSSSIKFEQRHPELFIAEWCFFISLCLFVALRSTEGFLLLTSAVQRCREMGGMWERQGGKGWKKGTKWPKGETKGGWDRVAGCMTFGRWLCICMKPLRGSEKVYFCRRDTNEKNPPAKSLCTCFSLIPSLWYNSRLHGKNWVVRIRSPSREAGLVEKRQPRCSEGKHHQQTQDTHWFIHHMHQHIHIHATSSHTNNYVKLHKSHMLIIFMCLYGWCKHTCWFSLALVHNYFTH